MLWVLLAAIVGSTIALAYLVWRKWIAPWREIENLVRHVGRGEQPRTFLVNGGREAERVGVALEDILTRQRTLDRQLAESASGQEAIFSAMQDGLLVVDGERRVALLNRTFAAWFGVPDNSLGAPLLEVVRDPALERLVDVTLETREAVQRELTIADRSLQMTSVPLANSNG
jgi:PAS domain-containing protein